MEIDLNDVTLGQPGHVMHSPTKVEVPFAGCLFDTLSSLGEAVEKELEFRSTIWVVEAFVCGYDTPRSWLVSWQKHEEDARAISVYLENEEERRTKLRCNLEERVDFRYYKVKQVDLHQLCSDPKLLENAFTGDY